MIRYATCLAASPAGAAALASQPASAWSGMGFDPGEGLRGGPPPLLLAVALPGACLRPVQEPRGLASRLAGRFARLRTGPDSAPHAIPADRSGGHPAMGATP